MSRLLYQLNALLWNTEFRNSTIDPIESNLRRQIEDKTWAPLYSRLMQEIEYKLQTGEKEDV